MSSSLVLKKLMVCSALIFIGLGFTIDTFGQLLIPEKTELYRDDIVPRIDIDINQESLDFILDQNNAQSNELFEATFIFSNGNVLDTLENVGFRLRGNTSRGASKKSFKIDLNAFVPGRKYYGVQKINLNGQHNDPTICRSKICADLADQLRIPSMRTNHVQLYINDSYYGLYTNVEHIDQNYVKKRFGNKNGNLYKCLYPADLNYKGDNPDAYKEIIYGRRNYALKSNTVADDYSDFAQFIKVLNLTNDANLPCELEQVFNVDQYLKAIIFDILTGNWDGPIYNKNNFYLYHNQTTGLFEYIPYDLDNTLGIDWLNKDWTNRNIYTWSQTNETRPIYNRIMSIQEYRDRFSFYMQEVLLTFYNEAEMYPYLEAMRDMLKEYVVDDTYYPLDYGFKVEDFENGFDLTLNYTQTDFGIKDFIQKRLIAAFTQLEINDIHPIIKDLKNNHPNVSEGIDIQAKIIDDESIESVEVCYTLNNSAEICLEMLDDGLQNDQEANDDIYSALLSPSLEVGEVDYFIKANDNTGQSSTFPRCTKQKIIIEETELKLVINEFMASNNTIISDEKGEYNDWIELYNYGSNPIYLGDKYLSDNPNNPDKWVMPNYIIQGGEYILFWADDDRNEGSFHTNFKLSKAGEYLGIYDDKATGNVLVDQIEFGNQESDISFGRIPNGTGEFVFLVPSPLAPNLTTSLNEGQLMEDGIHLFPNPTHDYVEILSNEIIDKVVIFDSTGNQIKLVTNTNKKFLLPNEKGIYFIQINTSSGSSHLKKIVRY